MSLRRFLDQSRLKRHRTSKEEIVALLRLVDRDIQDAQVVSLSSDRRSATAYNAVLQLGTILLYCEGYRPHGVGHHSTVFESMKEILGEGQRELADYFDSCRVKRNIADYTRSGEVSKTEVEELICEAMKFLDTVREWLRETHPDISANS